MFAVPSKWGEWTLAENCSEHCGRCERIRERICILGTDSEQPYCGGSQQLEDIGRQETTYENAPPCGMWCDAFLFGLFLITCIVFSVVYLFRYKGQSKP